MTIDKLEGFGYIANDSADLVARGWLFATGSRALAGGRFGGNGYRFNGTSQVLSMDAGNFVAQRYWGATWWANLANIGADSNIWLVRRTAPVTGTMPGGTSGHMTLRLKADGALELWTNSVLRQTTAAGLIVAGTDHHIETRLYISDAGTAEVWVDGVSVLSTAADTQQSFTSPTGIYFGGGTSTDCVIDDVVVFSGNTAAIGLHQIHDKLPDGAGDNAAWTGTFADVDDPLGVPDEDATVITSAEGQAKQDHTFEDLPAVTTIHALEVVARARAQEALPRSIIMYVISGATESQGPTKALTDTYGQTIDRYLTDPNTAAAWTEAAVNALKFGVKVDAPATVALPYRYVRFRFTSVLSGNVAMAEVQMRLVPAGADVTVVGQAVASGDIGGGFVAPNAIDNNANTMWNSGYSAGNTWWYADLGSSQAIVEYTIQARHDGFLGDTPRGWEVEGSDNAVDWTLIKSETTPIWPVVSEVRTFTLP